MHIEARRWFQKSCGNTYHSVRIFENGEQIGFIPFEYGYGQHWETTALKWLESKGYVTVEYNSRGARVIPMWKIFQSESISLSCVDVERKRDM